MTEAWWRKPFSKSEMDQIRSAARDDETLPQKFWSLMRRVGKSLPFVEDALAAFYCAFDPATPKRVRAILLGAIAYLVLPFDAIPDFVPLFGFTDDAAVIAAAIAAVRGSINEEHYAKARSILAGGFRQAN